ncbi:hypothetical protein KsCSTR_34120 [Candidatus Kuenenia stuttgartiensis]|uniref:Uncharacterized protein n=1 Tax=Kuenenia stuttgartiensis TaxID=174633 RepID=Q1Q490_KUEST|nr:hypothetical protein KsCSTR_34120 [Candidatus Kuenenia stuttgartiensis]CAJ74831.1 unknown protein [Candidatus Kuenenia stuttgartiensis]
MPCLLQLSCPCGFDPDAFPVFCEFCHALMKRTLVPTLSGLFYPDHINGYKKPGMLPFELKDVH